MKGMVPPVHVASGGSPVNSIDASLMASEIGPSSGGAWKPSEHESGVNVTCAPYGGSFSRISFARAIAYSESTPGGILKLSFRSVFVRRTFPASCTEGIPSAPMMDRVGSQFIATIMSSVVSEACLRVSTVGNCSHMLSPTISLREIAFSLTFSGISTCISGILTFPEDESSTLSNRIRWILKEEGIEPPEFPE